MGRAIGRSAVGLFLTFVAANVAFAGSDEKASAFVLCKQQKNVRTIRILPDQRTTQGGCIISYSKNGIDEVVGTNRTMGSCQSILKSIQTNLESAKWNCRTVGSATVTTSSEILRQ